MSTDVGDEAAGDGASREDALGETAPQEDASRTRRPWSRRRFLGLAGRAGVGAVALGAAGYGGYAWPWFSSPEKPPPASDSAVDTEAGARSFVSRPDLSPPRVTVTRRDVTDAGGRRSIFVAPKGYPDEGPGQKGLMILDRAGRLVWFRPTERTPMDLRVQTYRGDPVLTWWEGKVVSGHGQGEGVIVDSAYRTVGRVRAGDGLRADLHEFRLTSKDTALITAYRTTRADLSDIDGPADGSVYTGVVQEIDVATGAVLWSWDSLDHVPVTETRQELSDTGTKDKPFDYFHINSIAPAGDGDLLISSRHTWAVYKVSRSDGGIVWRLGGRDSDFELDSDAHFYWQHDAESAGKNRISLFDNGATPKKEKESRAIVLALDTDAGTASVERSYTHPAHLLADNQGSMQIMDDGRVFVGWGNQPYFSEFAEDGRLLLDGRFPANDQSYRAFTGRWTGRPKRRPALVGRLTNADRVTLFASWNGSTEVRRWRVLAGDDETDPHTAAHTRHAGFETAVTLEAEGPYFAVEALDAHGRTLGRSETIKVERG